MKRAKTILMISALLLTFIVTKQINVMQDTQEIWKDIPGYEGRYQASNFGQIRSLPKYHSNKIIILKQCNGPGGYLLVDLYSYKIHKTIYVHRLVLMAFHGVPNNNIEVNHKDGDKANNLLSNLEWCTRKENIRHAFKLGLCVPRRGEMNKWHILTKNDVYWIRKNRSLSKDNGRLTYSQLANKFGVSISAIQSVNDGRTWKHII